MHHTCLLGSFDYSRAGKNCKLLMGDIDGDGRMELLFVQPDGGIDDRYVPHQVTAITAFDLEGQFLWQFGEPVEEPGSAGSDYPAQVTDIDGDGNLEVLVVRNKRFYVLEGATGRVLREHALPGDEAHDCIIVADFSGNGHPMDIMLKDRYHHMWVMDKDWNLLWTASGNPGHFPWPGDYDGDGKDEIMAGYDMLDHDGSLMWQCQDLTDHADCLFVGDVNGDGEDELVVGGSVTIMTDLRGKEIWRYDGSTESQHVAVGKFCPELPGLQIASLDRIVRGDVPGNCDGKDGLFLLDSRGQELVREERTTGGWLTIAETLSGWDDTGRDYIFGWRRGGGVRPTLYDGQLNPVVTFPEDGYVVHGDVTGCGREAVLIYHDFTVSVYASEPLSLKAVPGKAPLKQSKRMSHFTLYPGGNYPDC